MDWLLLLVGLVNAGLLGWIIQVLAELQDALTTEEIRSSARHQSVLDSLARIDTRIIAESRDLKGEVVECVAVACAPRRVKK